MAAKNFPQSFNVLIIVLLLQVVTSLCKSESEILLDFKESLIGNNGALMSSWNTSTSPCSGNKGNWVGVLCEEGNIWGLKLENMGLSGVVDLESLKELRALRTISLTNNNFDGGLPDLKKLSALKSVYLSNNKFSGEIEGNAFDGMQSLKKIYLANNQFTGMIPLSMTILPKLIELSLEGNKFEGEIPDFPQSKLRSLNLSNNALEGQIPTSLSKMNASSFLGNEDLCGPPLEACASDSKLPVIIIVVVVIVVMAAALAAIAAVFIILRSRRQTSNQTMEAPTSHIVHKKKAAASANLDNIEEGSPEHSTSNKKAENSGKLSFLRDDRETFDLADLLKASAEVLGSGYFGSSYKAALITGKVMVVKRFKHVNNVGREEFQEHMRKLGRLRHPNLLPLVAFYYRKEEKLLVSDYVDNVSLAVHLHGNRSRGQLTLDWPTRLKIIKGVAKGLSYLYNELPNLTVPHGHLKSSNVLLNESFEPLLTDYGLLPVVNQEHAQEVLLAYKSPEYKQHGRITKKTDIWSFGILILEILTGKFPSNYLQQDKGSDTDLVSWVHSVVHEEWTCDEVFDKDMGLGETKNSDAKTLMKLLKIGLACAENDVEKRCDLKKAIEKIEQLKENTDEDLKSSRGLSDDLSFSMNR